MKHVVCYSRYNPNEITYEYDYDDTPEIETPEMLDRCYHDDDDDFDLDAWLERQTF